jgi:endonuclease YncB( thermonuclease family)
VPAPAPAKPFGTLSGVPEVVDTSTLRIDGRVVRLFGVEWERGAQAEDLTRYIAGREVVCAPAVRTDRHRCQIEGRDLSEIVLFNGGGRATAEATPELKAAEAKARAGSFGIWQKPGSQ